MTHSYLVRFQELLFWKFTNQTALASGQKNNKNFSPTADLKAQLAFQGEAGNILHSYSLQIPWKDQDQQSVDPTDKYYLCIEGTHVRLRHRALLLSKNDLKHIREPRRLTSSFNTVPPFHILLLQIPPGTDMGGAKNGSSSTDHWRPTPEWVNPR